MPRHKEGEANTLDINMIAQDNEQVKPDPGLINGSDGENNTPVPVSQEQVLRIESAKFFTDIAVPHPDGVQGLVFERGNGKLDDHLWNMRGADPGNWTAEKANGKKPAYMTMGTFRRDAVERFKGRTKDNVLALGGFWIDVEGSEDKGGYEGKKNVLAAVVEFGRATSVTPTHIVMTGSGGAHLHYVLSKPITPAEWLGRAQTLVALAAQHRLRIDAPVTTDAARIMRAPGSIHQKTGVEVLAYRWRTENYELDVWDRLTGYVPATEPLEQDEVGPVPEWAKSTGINGLVLEDKTKYSYKRAAEKCGAMRQAAQRNGRDTPYPVWILAIKTADLSTEGREYAHEISSGHEKYDHDKTDKKINSLTGGPAGCDAWANAYGAGGPCDTCEWRGKIENPAVQLGTEGDVVADEVIDGGQVASADLSMPDWVTRVVEDEKGNRRTRKVRPHNTSANVEALANAKGWSIQYNVMSKRTELTRDGVVVAGDDADNVALTLFGDDAVRAGLARDGLGALVDAVAVGKSFHPVLVWIEATPWDGQDRLPAFYDTLTLADPRKAELTHKLMDKWMLQGIGALVEPKGITASGLLVLTGPQYIGKSWWVLHLIDGALNAVGTGLGLDPKEKDSVLKAVRFFISELAELDGTFRRADIAALKGFLTDGVDVVRLPYARRDTPFARRTIFCASVNDDRYLVDETGNRRFWTIPVTRCSVLSAPVMQQVWAQYLHKYKEGERWGLDPTLLVELNASNLDHEVIDPLRERIATRWDWDSVDWSAIQADQRANTPGLVWKTASDVCLAIGIERPSRAEATRVGGVIRALSGGITFARKSHGVKLLAVPKRFGSST